VAGLEDNFDATFATSLALREKQIQQNYRPVIGVHKWFARRPGTLFRCLLLAEFAAGELEQEYWTSHSYRGVIADPFMGGGTPIFEATRLGFNVVGADINPMAYWLVRQSLAPLDVAAFRETAARVVSDVAGVIGDLYRTRCLLCRRVAEAKYFLWVKQERCSHCDELNDLFPGYLLAEAVRHPRHVVACPRCGELNEYDDPPTKDSPARCHACRSSVHVDGAVRRQRFECVKCGKSNPLTRGKSGKPPAHRLWALEYHCAHCKPSHSGRFFKKPSEEDLALFSDAEERLRASRGLPIPADEIPAGDETDRLHRWGYRRYREMFNARQLLGLGTLLKRIQRVTDVPMRHALLTVFSDHLRYQNMLCRYDTYALKCQDIFSVHGFPVGLVQCENNLLGIPRVGSGSFVHFIEKYARAKEYCARPFETDARKGRKKFIPVENEHIAAELVSSFPTGTRDEAWLLPKPAADVRLPANSLDGVFTDPPYFDNVQYAELMDFCFAWLRIALADERPEFRRTTTRSPGELTGNDTLGRDLEHFTAGVSEIFTTYAAALKPNAPFVFTYHHNDPKAYVPIVVAILDAGLACTATHPAAAEMGASLHIAGTGSSVLDTVFVCRRRKVEQPADSTEPQAVGRLLTQDRAAMLAAGVKLTAGDLRCLAAGHIARLAVARLRATWRPNTELTKRMARVERTLSELTESIAPERIVERLCERVERGGERRVAAV
jgi:adenine-specific DNA methylase